MDQERLSILRIVAPMGHPDIIECDGARYVEQHTAHIDFFEGDTFCTRCKNYVDVRDTYFKHCGAKFEHGWRYLGTVAANAAGEVFQPVLKEPESAGKKATTQEMEERMLANARSSFRTMIEYGDLDNLAHTIADAVRETLVTADHAADMLSRELCQNYDKDPRQIIAERVDEIHRRAAQTGYLQLGA